MNGDKNPLRELTPSRSASDSATLVIFGATGDLTARKLMPALYSLFCQDLLPGDFKIVGFARRPKTSEIFRNEIASYLQNLNKGSRLDSFLSAVHYHRGDYTLAESHVGLKKKLEKFGHNRLFYLATPPSQYESIITNLGTAQLAATAGGWIRVIIEKPFGHDVKRSGELNRFIARVFNENQIYRIDHYLGKETVQNILVFRLANGIFEPIWNRRYVDHVQITVAEKVGVEGRGRFFEETGILRDIVQNHMLQLLCLTAMEPPSTFDANAVRDEKVKVLQSIRAIEIDQVENTTVRAQYAAGSMDGIMKKGYLQEEGVDPLSSTETFTALQLYPDNWRWAGVPFYLRTGKRLPKRVTEISIYFKDAPLKIFGKRADDVKPNVLTLNIQPDEGISLRFDSKVPGQGGKIRPVTMDFRYGTSFGVDPPDAYERLLLDALLGDSTLFTRADESENAWRIIQPILDYWQNYKKKPLPQYNIGTWGPAEAAKLLKRSGRRWRRL
ncbi:glucose-6-phosphate dehydrogenase [candidate division KSB1 bacterium]|nr:glucose-6-phosphate dehydrogenase [candidate division KSB1 bacterium]